jgi:hypothetical protein
MSKVQSVEGRIDAIGAYVIRQSAIWYSFIRWAEPNGELVSLKEVGAPNELDDYLQKGADGKFCYYNQQAPGLFERKRVNVLCGFRSSTRTHIIPPEEDPAVAQIKWRMGRNKIHVTLGVLGSFVFGIGIPYLIAVLLERRTLKIERPSDDEIRSALAT